MFQDYFKTVSDTFGDCIVVDPDKNTVFYVFGSGASLGCVEHISRKPLSLQGQFDLALDYSDSAREILKRDDILVNGKPKRVYH